MAFKKNLTLLVALSSTIAGCNERFAGLECNSNSALSTVNEIARRQLISSTSVDVAAVIDLPKARIYVENIRTRETDRKKSVCGASIRYEFDLAQNVILLDDQGLAKAAEQTSGEISYIVEYTDEKKLFITVNGLRKLR